jgi:uncharacterized membrane protein YsdA (DUF1294 family)
MLYYLIGACLALLNLVLFVLFGRDKAAARRGARRTPETTLLALAVLGGSLGGLLGMLLFRHKTRKPAFRIGLPVILICQLLLAGWLLHMG